MKKRYAVFSSYYIWAENEEEAIYQAKYHAVKQEAKNDDSCTIDEIRDASEGGIERRVIYKR